MLGFSAFKGEEMFIRKGKCKHTLYLLEHKFVKYKGLGYRCKYCGKSKVRGNK